MPYITSQTLPVEPTLPALLGRVHESANDDIKCDIKNAILTCEDASCVDNVSTNDIEAFVERYEYAPKSYATLYRKMFVRAEGMRIFDDAGKAYLDCLNGFGVNPLGHNPPCLQETLVKYVSTRPLWSAIDLYTPERVEFITTLFENVPVELQNYKICFTGPTGSEANEMALKMARKSTGRMGIFAFRGCFHGSTITTCTLTGNTGDGDFIRSAGHIHHMPFPREQAADCPYKKGGEESVDLCLMHVQGAVEDAKGGTNMPAAMIIEPVQSDGGIIPVPARFLEGLRALCNKHDIVFISDEVQCGFGKTGHLFGYQRASIVPDILTCSKAWGGGQPLAFVLYGSRITPMAPTGTWRGNQIAFKLGAAFLRELMDQRVLSNVSKIEKFWNGEMAAVKNFRGVHDFRVCGGLLALEFDSPSTSKAVFDAFLEADVGLLTKRGGRDYRTLIFWFSLNIPHEELECARALIMAGLRKVLLPVVA
jgi:diaminobutyrate-2-oxoglutarate transaminase